MAMRRSDPAQTDWSAGGRRMRPKGRWPRTVRETVKTAHCKWADMDTPLIFLPNRTALITLLRSNELDARMVWFRGGNTGRIDGDEVCPAEEPCGDGPCERSHWLRRTNAL